MIKNSVISLLLAYIIYNFNFWVEQPFALVLGLFVVCLVLVCSIENLLETFGWRL